MGLQNTLRALADPIRRDILNLLRDGRLSAGEICAHFPVTAASISRHLSVLKDADLIRDTREGKHVYYELNASVLEEILLWIAEPEGGRRTVKATLREHRAALILTSLTILLPLPAVSLARGALFWPPLVQLALHWAGVLWTLRDWQRRPQSPAALGIVLWIMPTVSLLSASVFSLATSGAGGAEAVMTVLFFGFGLLFLCLGNYLPRIRQNRTLGIKVRWALESEENWNATHRFGGKVWMACGVLSMACGLLPLGAATAVFTAALLAAAAAPCLYSWQYYRRQLREGTAVRLPRRPGAALLTLGMTAAAAGLVAWALLSGSMEVVYGDASFTVDSSWQDLTIAYGDVDSVAYEPQDPSGALADVRTNGFGNLRLSMGAFHNDLYGDYTRYTWSACDACVVLRVDGETVVLNGRDEDATRAIYDALRERTGRG